MSALRRTLLAAAATVGAGIAGSTLLVPHRVALPPALGGRRQEFAGRSGMLSCYVDGDGPPLLLLHSINAAASAYEVRPLAEHLRTRYRVYAPDLPGFGFSERSQRRYDIALYLDAVRDVLEVIARDTGDTPVVACALSLSAEFLARVALEQPDRIAQLVFINPTGFARAYAGPPRPGDREIPGLHGVVAFPLWSQALYDALVSRRSIRYFLERTYGSAAVDEPLIEYDWLTAHQPGARFAPLAFLSGRLFSRDIQSVYRQLSAPVFMPHGTRGDFRDFSAADWARAHDRWTVTPFDSGAMPHFERRAEFNAALDRFLAAPG